MLQLTYRTELLKQEQSPLKIREPMEKPAAPPTAKTVETEFAQHLPLVGRKHHHRQTNPAHLGPEPSSDEDDLALEESGDGYQQIAVFSDQDSICSGKLIERRSD